MSIFAGLNYSKAKHNAKLLEEQVRVAQNMTKETQKALEQVSQQKKDIEKMRDTVEQNLTKLRAEEAARLIAEQVKRKDEITRLLSEADTYLRANLYKNARAKLEQVLAIDPKNREAKEKLKNLQ